MSLSQSCKSFIGGTDDSCRGGISINICAFRFAAGAQESDARLSFTEVLCWEVGCVLSSRLQSVSITPLAGKKLDSILFMVRWPTLFPSASGASCNLISLNFFVLPVFRSSDLSYRCRL